MQHISLYAHVIVIAIVINLFFFVESLLPFMAKQCNDCIPRGPSRTIPIHCGLSGTAVVYAQGFVMNGHALFHLRSRAHPLLNDKFGEILCCLTFCSVLRTFFFFLSRVRKLEIPEETQMMGNGLKWQIF